MLKEQLQHDATQALKEGDQNRASVLRLTLAAILAKEKEKRYRLSKESPKLPENALNEQSALTEGEAIALLSSEIKKRNDAIALYERGNRPELAQKERQEIDIIKRYLPEQLSAQELEKLAAESIAKTEAKTIKDMGRVMADLTPKITGRASGSDASTVIKKLLNSP